MDVLKAWVLAIIAYLAMNFVLSLLGPAMGLVYGLCPFVAALAASAFHAARGSGGWLRHLLAVLPVPILLGWYWVVLLAPGPGSLLLSRLGGATLSAGIAALLGFGVVMLGRALLSGRRDPAV